MVKVPAREPKGARWNRWIANIWPPPGVVLNRGEARPLNSTEFVNLVTAFLFVISLIGIMFF